MSYQIIKLRQHELADYKGKIISVLDYCCHENGLIYDDDQPRGWKLICLVEENMEELK